MSTPSDNTRSRAQQAEEQSVGASHANPLPQPDERSGEESNPVPNRCEDGSSASFGSEERESFMREFLVRCQEVLTPMLEESVRSTFGLAQPPVSVIPQTAAAPTPAVESPPVESASTDQAPPSPPRYVPSAQRARKGPALVSLVHEEDVSAQPPTSSSEGAELRGAGTARNFHSEGTDSGGESGLEDSDTDRDEILLSSVEPLLPGDKVTLGMAWEWVCACRDTYYGKPFPFPFAVPPEMLQRHSGERRSWLLHVAHMHQFLCVLKGLAMRGALDEMLEVIDLGWESGQILMAPFSRRKLDVDYVFSSVPTVLASHGLMEEVMHTRDKMRKDRRGHKSSSSSPPASDAEDKKSYRTSWGLPLSTKKKKSSQSWKNRGAFRGKEKKSENKKGEGGSSGRRRSQPRGRSSSRTMERKQKRNT